MKISRKLQSSMSKLHINHLLSPHDTKKVKTLNKKKSFDLTRDDSQEALTMRTPTQNPQILKN